MSKYQIIGIKFPGRINLRLRNRFQEVALYHLDERSLEDLFNDGCPYVVLAQPPVSTPGPIKPIQMRDLLPADKPKVPDPVAEVVADPVAEVVPDPVLTAKSKSGSRKSGKNKKN